VTNITGGTSPTTRASYIAALEKKLTPNQIDLLLEKLVWAIYLIDKESPAKHGDIHIRYEPQKLMVQAAPDNQSNW
jgi:hypothetical protein